MSKRDATEALQGLVRTDVGEVSTNLARRLRARKEPPAAPVERPAALDALRDYSATQNPVGTERLDGTVIGMPNSTED